MPTFETPGTRTFCVAAGARGNRIAVASAVVDVDGGDRLETTGENVGATHGRLAMMKIFI
jgi:hypothetical protein